MSPRPDTTFPVAYLTTARLSEKGQLTVPKEYRDALALEAGTPITVLQLGSCLLLIPEQEHFRQLCDRITTTFASHGIQAHDLLSTLPATRERVFARHYPQPAQSEPARKRVKRK
ncbi:MAG TPA: AbrB/MazE/SpoVT family DNA-binding domain-containing protein [Candidatus Tectomicrobia bacterium]|jgi:bifunctional DNA-binding transcriptional regulator/antitoxin component of YhaV-PrlF toxin-antitoxin module